MRPAAWSAASSKGGTRFSKSSFERLRESLLQFAPPPAVHQNLQPQTDLEDGDRPCPDGFGWQTVEPRHHGRLGLASHQGREPRWCRARLLFEVGRAGRLIAQLGDLFLRESYAGETSCQP